MEALRKIIENAWEDRELLKQEATQNAIREVVGLLDSGTLRVAEPAVNGWQVNEWVKKTHLNLYLTMNGTMILICA